jgi:hypothetical protein
LLEVEVLVNLSYLLYDVHKSVDVTSMVGTILKLFNDEGVLSDSTLLKWADGKLNDKMA